METYRDYWHKKYGLGNPRIPVEDGSPKTPPDKCSAKGGPDRCPYHGPVVRKADEVDCLMTEPPFPFLASRMPDDAFEDGEAHGIPIWFQTLYHIVAEVALATDGKPDSTEKQKQAVLAATKGKDYWLGDLTALCKEKYGERFAHGMESDVYDTGDAVVKMLTMRLAGSPVVAMERIVLHNRLFQDTMLEVMGCGWANRYGKPDGKMAFLVKQRKVEFDKSETTPEDVAKFMEELGFKRGIRKSTYVSADGSLLATDMHMENVVKTKDGKMAVLDSLMKLNTEAEGLKGTYDVENPPKTMWTPKNVGAGKGATGMDEQKKKTSVAEPGVATDPFEIPGTGMTSAEWHRRRREQQYAAEGLDPRRLTWEVLHEQAERLKAQRREGGD